MTIHQMYTIKLNKKTDCSKAIIIARVANQKQIIIVGVATQEQMEASDLSGLDTFLFCRRNSSYTPHYL